MRPREHMPEHMLNPCSNDALRNAWRNARTNELTHVYSPRDVTHVGKRAQGGLAKPPIQGLTSVGEALQLLAPDLESAGRTRHPVIRTNRTEIREPISRESRIYVYQRDKFHCIICGDSTDLTLDHIIPWSAGGTDHVNNLRTLCWPCNSRRSNFRYLCDNWRPLPLAYACIYCEAELLTKYPDDETWPIWPPDHTFGPVFCWWHRRATIGWPA